MERLRSCIVGALDPDEFCDAVLARCADSATSHDDVALLAVRHLSLGDELQLSLPACPGTLRPLRRTLRRWLHDAGATEEEPFDVLVATGEACSNVIRHAPAAGATFELDLRRNGDVSITVRNPGRWRERSDPRDGGRGFWIMGELMDDFEITEGPPETVVVMRRSLGDRDAVSPV